VRLPSRISSSPDEKAGLDDILIDPIIDRDRRRAFHNPRSLTSGSLDG